MQCLPRLVRPLPLLSSKPSRALLLLLSSSTSGNCMLLSLLDCHHHHCHRRGLSLFRSLPLGKNHSLPSRPPPPPETDIEESFLRGSGPGGQKINKTSSAVQLKHIPTGIVVKSQATRSRSQNRNHARRLLAQKLDDLANGEQSRSSVVGKIKQKKAASASKKSRRKYRQLDKDKADAAQPAGESQFLDSTASKQPNPSPDAPTSRNTTLSRGARGRLPGAPE